MNRAKITGINGSIEIDNKYIYLVIGTKNALPSKSKVILFEEVEDVIYRKPTRDRYGYLTLYLSTKNYISKANEKYTLILDKVNEKYLEEVNRIYNFLNELKYINRDIKIEEQETLIEGQDEPEEIEELIKSNKPQQDKKETRKEEKQESKDLITGIKITNVNVQNIDAKSNIKQDGIKTKEEESILSPFIQFNPNKKARQIIEEISPIDNVPSKKEQSEKEKQDEEFDNINRLEKKLKELEKDLIKLDYKITILNKYTDETKEKEEIDKLVEEVRRIIEELEKIEKEFGKNQKNLKQNKSIKFGHGLLVVSKIGDNVESIDKEDLYDFVDKYNETLKRIEDVEKKTEKLAEDTDKKKDEIGLADEVFEKDLLTLRRVENTKEFIEKYTREAIEDIRRVRRQIDITTDTRTRLRYINRGISRQTRNLYRIAMLTSMMPGLNNKLIALALTARTGVGAITDILHPQAIEEQYTEVTRTETLIGVDDVDTVSARGLIDDSLKQLDKILEDCEKKYGDYPQFDELKKELTDVKEEIEKENERLKEVEYQLQKYREEEKVKVLKYNQG